MEYVLLTGSPYTKIEIKKKKVLLKEYQEKILTSLTNYSILSNFGIKVLSFPSSLLPSLPASLLFPSFSFLSSLPFFVSFLEHRIINVVLILMLFKWYYIVFIAL